MENGDNWKRFSPYVTLDELVTPICLFFIEEVQ